MKNNKIRRINLALNVLFIVGLIETLRLVYHEVSIGNVCPQFLTIPVCYIILVCISIPFLVHIFQKFYSLYFVFAGLALLVASLASGMQIFGLGECPDMGYGPMCFYSFLLFGSLLFLYKHKLKVLGMSKNNS